MESHPTQSKETVPQNQNSLPNDNKPQTLDNEDKSPVYLLRILLGGGAFVLLNLIEDYLELHFWSGLVIGLSLLLALAGDPLRKKFLGSKIEQRLGGWLYSLLPLIILGILIFVLLRC
jgi:hypothetical protein